MSAYEGTVARLGELLLAEKLIQIGQLEEALEAQVVHGGRLGTNLVELGSLAEADLARMLGKQHNLPFASGQMVPDTAALSLVSRKFCDDEDVLPMRLEATRLAVAVLGPHQVKALDALAFKAGKRVVAVVIPEMRMHQLLRLHCKAFRPMRSMDVVSLRPMKAELETQSAPEDLINEDDFAKLYAKAVGEAEVDDDAEIVQGEALEEEVIAAAPVVQPAPSPIVSEPPPLTFMQAQKQLQESTGREDIGRTVLQFARSKFARTLLFNVHAELLTGWQGMGKGMNAKAVRRIGVNLREKNTFRLVCDLKSHFIGPMKKTADMAVFYELLGGGYPQTAVILPLLVRGKLAHLLYVDGGPGQLTTPDVGELLILSQRVAHSYEALIRERQAERAR